MNEIERELTKMKRRVEDLQKEDFSKYDDDYKIFLGIEERVYQKIIEDIEFQILTSELKQAKRILQVAKDREQGWDVIERLKEIKVYSKIIEVLPYILSVSYKLNNVGKHLTQDLYDFCKTQIEKIDGSFYNHKFEFPTKHEIDEAFRSYNEIIKTNKIPALKVYHQPEVAEKIEELYIELINLQN